jgi:hypothetical protein
VKERERERERGRESLPVEGGGGGRGGGAVVRMDESEEAGDTLYTLNYKCAFPPQTFIRGNW